jgi:hypothetical protein
MALILLQPGIQPLGQFDMDDADASPVGGEVGVLAALDVDTDGYAADSGDVGPRLQVELDSVANTLVGDPADGVAANNISLFGLVDDGDTGYGTLMGTAIGGTAGQGTGLGARAAVGVVVMGPVSSFASGKCTLWTKPGLYGVTEDGFAAGTGTDFGLNDILDGTATTGLLAAAAGASTTAALFIGAANDSSLVSTTNTAIGTAANTEYNAVYLLGPQS